MLRRNAALLGALVMSMMIAACQEQNKAATDTPAPDQTASIRKELPPPLPPPEPTPPPMTEPAEAEVPPAVAPAEAPSVSGTPAKPLPREQYAKKPAHKPRTHVVKSGETLQSISKKYYGDPNKWRRIYEANRQRISDPRKMQVGMKLIIP